MALMKLNRRPIWSGSKPRRSVPSTGNTALSMPLRQKNTTNVARYADSRTVPPLRRSDQPGRVVADPGTSGDLTPLIVANNNLCYEEARGLEQRLQDRYGPLITKLINKIRGIALSNPRPQRYLDVAGHILAEAIARVEPAADTFAVNTYPNFDGHTGTISVVWMTDDSTDSEVQ
jgi:hypothetical protein